MTFIDVEQTGVRLLASW